MTRWDTRFYSHHQWHLVLAFFNELTDLADELITDLSDILEEKTWRGGDFGDRYAVNRARYESFEAHCTESVQVLTRAGVQQEHLKEIVSSVVGRITAAAVKHSEQDAA